MKLRTVLVVFALVACDGLMGKPSKMSSGELYEAGDPKYDSFLKKVHDEQVAAANWPEESKAARKPLTTALNLPPNASNSSILSAAKEKKGNATVQGAAEETAALEKAFAEKQRSNANRLDKLAHEGAELKRQAVEDRRNMGADKADPAKVDKKEEIKNEVSAAVEVAANLRNDAKKGVLDTERLIEGLKKELGIVGDGISKKDDPAPAKKDEPKKDEPKKPEAKKPATKPKPAEAKPAEDKPEKPAPAPKPAPTQKPPDEVFNP